MMINQLTRTDASGVNEMSFKMAASISSSDLQEVLVSHSGSAAFEQALGRIATSEDLLTTLSCYIYFNSVFGSGVANLSGEIGARQSLFRDPDEPLTLVADRSVEVAAQFFFAAIDEFGGPSHRSTHRTLAQATLKGCGSFLQFDLAALNQLAEPNAATLTAIEKVQDGYAINQLVDEQKLFRAIGFHMGSEVLADAEFNLLDGFLRAKYSDLVEHLKRSRVTINGVELSGYHWIQIHTTVEADHFDAAMVGANLALRFYCGGESPAQIKQWMLDGFRLFATAQSDFMNGLMQW
jgi:hypothetical protein